MEDRAKKQFDTLYTQLLTGTYEKSAGTGLVRMCDLIGCETDKMSIQLLLQMLERNRGKLSDITKMDIAERIIGKKGLIETGVAFVAFVKGDRPTSKRLQKLSEELCSEAAAENVKNRERAEALIALCKDFSAKEKEIIKMKLAGDMMSMMGLFSGKTPPM